MTFRLLLDQFQRLVIAFKKQQTGDSGDQIAMLMLYGAQVIGILLYRLSCRLRVLISSLLRKLITQPCGSLFKITAIRLAITLI